MGSLIQQLSVDTAPAPTPAVQTAHWSISPVKQAFINARHDIEEHAPTLMPLLELVESVSFESLNASGKCCQGSIIQQYITSSERGLAEGEITPTQTAAFAALLNTLSFELGLEVQQDAADALYSLAVDSI